MPETGVYAYECNNCGVVFDSTVINQKVKCINCNDLLSPISYEMASKIHMKERVKTIRMRNARMILLSVGILIISIIHDFIILTILSLFIVIINILSLYKETLFIREIKTKL